MTYDTFKNSGCIVSSMPTIHHNNCCVDVNCTLTTLTYCDYVNYDRYGDVSMLHPRVRSFCVHLIPREEHCVKWFPKKIHTCLYPVLIVVRITQNRSHTQLRTLHIVSRKILYLCSRHFSHRSQIHVQRKSITWEFVRTFSISKLTIANVSIIGISS